jgi:plastocyanin
MSARWFTAFLVTAALAVTLPVSRIRAAVPGGLEGVVRVDGQPEKDVVVWLIDVPASRPTQGRAVLDQRKLTFTPHILAVRVGTSVEMPNNDRVFHNVFSFKDGKKFDLGLYPSGASKLVTFDRPGVSRIFCNIHPSMAAYVVAVDSAFFGVSDNAGRFTMPTVPPGTYIFRAWRPGQDVVSGQVVVESERPLEVRLP